MSTPLLQVIIGSTRPGRVGLPVASWFKDLASNHPGFDVELVDLAEVDLPLFDEPNHPRLAQYTHDHTKRWSEIVGRADAYVFVIPEYNYGFNAVTKNAIDYLHNEWLYKAVGLVTYGGVAAGTRAGQMLKQVLTALKMVPVPESVNLPFVASMLDDDGAFQANEIAQKGALAMLDELSRWTEPLRSLRSPG